MIIKHNIPAMNSFRNLKNNQKAISGNLEKLSSGYQINRAGDNAAGLSISEKMRSQITGLAAAQENVADGISLIRTAEGALQETQDMLHRMTELATQSANGTYDNEVDRQALQAEVDELLSEIDRIGESTNFNGINLIDGSLDESIPIDYEGKVYFDSGGLDAVKVDSGTFYSNTYADASLTEVLKGNNFDIGVGDLNLVIGYTKGDGTTYEIDLSSISTDRLVTGSADYSDSMAMSSINTRIEMYMEGLYAIFKEDTLLQEALGTGAITQSDVSVFFEKAEQDIYDALTGGGSSLNPLDVLNVFGEFGEDWTTPDRQLWLQNLEYNLSDKYGYRDASYNVLVVNSFTSSNTNQYDYLQEFYEDHYSYSVHLINGSDYNGGLYDNMPFPQNERRAYGTVLNDIEETKIQVLEQINDILKREEADIIATYDNNGNLVLSGTSVNVCPGNIIAASNSASITTGNQIYDCETESVWKDDSLELYFNEDWKDGDKITVNGVVLEFTNEAQLEGTTGTENQQYISLFKQDDEKDGKNDVGVLKDSEELAESVAKALNAAAYAARQTGDTDHGLYYMGTILAQNGIVTLKTEYGNQNTGDALTLQIGDTSDDFNKLDINVGDMRAEALGVDKIDVSTQDNAAAAIDVIKKAVNTVSMTRSVLGANQNRLEHTANNLSVYEENIQDAESKIRDTDVAEEMMAYTTNNILIQSAQSMLAQANQSTQGVLQLLG